MRYTYDEKHFKLNALPVESELGPFCAMGFTTDGYLHDTKDWDEFTPRAIVRYHPSNDWMVFASVTRGYKSGGFGSFAINPDQPFGTVGVTQARGAARYVRSGNGLVVRNRHQGRGVSTAACASPRTCTTTRMKTCR